MMEVLLIPGMGSGDPSRMELRPSLPEWNLIADVRRELVLHTLVPPLTLVACMCFGRADSLVWEERGGDLMERFFVKWLARAEVGELLEGAPGNVPPGSSGGVEVVLSEEEGETELVVAVSLTLGGE